MFPHVHGGCDGHQLHRCIEVRPKIPQRRRMLLRAEPDPPTLAIHSIAKGRHLPCLSQKLTPPGEGRRPTCPLGHGMQWTTTTQGPYARGWHCDRYKVCHGSSLGGMGRWCCVLCQKDLCPKCCPPPSDPRVQAWQLVPPADGGWQHSTSATRLAKLLSPTSNEGVAALVANAFRMADETGKGVLQMRQVLRFLEMLTSASQRKQPSTEALSKLCDDVMNKYGKRSKGGAQQLDVNGLAAFLKQPMVRIIIEGIPSMPSEDRVQQPSAALTTYDSPRSAFQDVKIQRIPDSPFLPAASSVSSASWEGSLLDNRQDSNLSGMDRSTFLAEYDGIRVTRMDTDETERPPSRSSVASSFISEDGVLKEDSSGSFNHKRRLRHRHQMRNVHTAHNFARYISGSNHSLKICRSSSRSRKREMRKLVENEETTRENLEKEEEAVSRHRALVWEMERDLLESSQVLQGRWWVVGKLGQVDVHKSTVRRSDGTTAELRLEGFRAAETQIVIESEWSPSLVLEGVGKLVSAAADCIVWSSGEEWKKGIVTTSRVIQLHVSEAISTQSLLAAVAQAAGVDVSHVELLTQNDAGPNIPWKKIGAVDPQSFDMSSVERWVIPSDYLIPTTRKHVANFIDAFSKCWMDKCGDLLDEIVDTLVVPSSADINVLLSTLMESIWEEHKYKFPRHHYDRDTPRAGRMLVLMCLILGTMPGHDVDRIVGFEDAPSFNPQEIKAYKERIPYRDRNGCITDGISQGFRKSDAAGLPLDLAEITANCKPWIRWNALFLAICEPSDLGTDRLLSGSWGSFQNEGLSGLNSDTGVFYRGGPATPGAMELVKQLHCGDYIDFRYPVRATRKERFAVENAKRYSPGMLLRIIGVREVVPIGRFKEYPYNSEVLLPPFTMFEVEQNVSLDDYVLVTLRVRSTRVNLRELRVAVLDEAAKAESRLRKINARMKGGYCVVNFAINSPHSEKLALQVLASCRRCRGGGRDELSMTRSQEEEPDQFLTDAVFATRLVPLSGPLLTSLKAAVSDVAHLEKATKVVPWATDFLAPAIELLPRLASWQGLSHVILATSHYRMSFRQFQRAVKYINEAIAAVGDGQVPLRRFLRAHSVQALAGFVEDREELLLYEAAKGTGESEINRALEAVELGVALYGVPPAALEERLIASLSLLREQLLTKIMSILRIFFVHQPPGSMWDLPEGVADHPAWHRLLTLIRQLGRLGGTRLNPLRSPQEKVKQTESLKFEEWDDDSPKGKGKLTPVDIIKKVSVNLRPENVGLLSAAVSLSQGAALPVSLPTWVLVPLTTIFALAGTLLSAVCMQFIHLGRVETVLSSAVGVMAIVVNVTVHISTLPPELLKYLAPVALHLTRDKRSREMQDIIAAFPELERQAVMDLFLMISADSSNTVDMDWVASLAGSLPDMWEHAARHVSSLHLACRQGVLPLAEYLIGGGVEVDASNRAGAMPLHETVACVAAFRAKRSLLERNTFALRSKVARRDSQKKEDESTLKGVTVLPKGLLAMPDGRVEWYHSSTFSRMNQFETQRSRDVWQCITTRHALKRLEGSLCETALHKACRHGLVEVAQLLLDAGAITTLVDASGQTPLHHSVRHPAFVNSTNGVNCMKRLTVDAAMVDAGGAIGTPLHVAAEESNVVAVKLLLAIGADPLLPNKLGFSPLDVAEQKTGDIYTPALTMQAIGQLTMSDAARVARILREHANSKGDNDPL